MNAAAWTDVDKAEASTETVRCINALAPAKMAQAAQKVGAVMLHFSSSRAVVWIMEDPYRYRLLDIEALIDPDICLAYPRTPYPTGALVPAEQVRGVLDALRTLRLMDEMFYLRSGTLNIFNGLVGLTFSCDGSHYISYDEFLRKDHDFWTGLTLNKEG